MARAPLSSVDASVLLEACSEPVRILPLALRERVCTILLPEAIEWIDVSDRMFFYGRERTARGEICYLKPLKDRVNLGFMQGVHLPDPSGLLEGTGNVLRHVKVRTLAAVDAPALTALLHAALAHHRSKLLP